MRATAAATNKPNPIYSPRAIDGSNVDTSRHGIPMLRGKSVAQTNTQANKAISAIAAASTTVFPIFRTSNRAAPHHTGTNSNGSAHINQK